jgi:hypothetical protein
VGISPQSQALVVNQVQNFTATVQNDSQNKGVTWALSGCAGVACGTLSSAATASGAPVTYTAITVAAPSPQVTVAVSPASQTIPVNRSQAFAATVQNDSQNKGVTWALSGTGCAGVTCGTLSNTSSASGAPITYTAPANVPNPATVTLTATSVADQKSLASATIRRPHRSRAQLF